MKFTPQEERLRRALASKPKGWVMDDLAAEMSKGCKRKMTIANLRYVMSRLRSKGIRVRKFHPAEIA